STLACGCFFLFFTESASIEIYTLSLHDALPICVGWEVADPVSFCFIEVKPDLSGGAVEPRMKRSVSGVCKLRKGLGGCIQRINRSEEHTSELQSRENLVCRLLLEKKKQ